MSYPHQNWEPITIRKFKTKDESVRDAARAGEIVVTDKPKPSGTKKVHDIPGALPTIVRADMSIKAHIEAGRRAKKWDQQMLANACSMPVATIKQYENGSAIAKAAELQKICKALGIPQLALPKPKSTST